MKTNKLKNFLALSLSAIAMVVAATSSTMCCVYFEEPKMPKSLYKVD
ncbi:cyclic lactone autoinducer peptide [Clostridium sp. C2-6-12]|nr:cyclic lactone autoinducer peptide [Clostridium sp. C2-6-12]